MTKISIPRLRAFHDDGAAAHAALIAANERVRFARRHAQDARETLELHRETRHLRQPPTKVVPNPNGAGRVREYMGDPDRHTRAAEAAFAEAEKAVEAALAAQASAHERYSLASTLASRARDYAASIGALPADLMEH